MLILPLIVLPVLIFLGLIFVFRHVMDKNVTSATRHLGELNVEYGKKDREVNRRLDEAKRASDDMLAKASSEMAKEKARIIQETETEKEKILKQAHAESEEIMSQADKSKSAMLAEIEERIANAATEKACDLVEAVLSGQFKVEVHSAWVDDLLENGFKQLDKFRIGEDVTEARITSAIPLEEKQRGKLSQKLESIFNKDIAIKEDVDPKVVAGVIITIGSLVLDGSLRDKIREKIKHAG